MTQPPRIATWMLKHFGSGPDNDTLLGDLAEQYRRNGSAMWYWRQALKAMPVSFFKEIRRHKWIAARALLTGWATWMIFVTMIPLHVPLAFFFSHRYFGELVVNDAALPLLVGMLCGWRVSLLHRNQPTAVVLLFATSFIFLNPLMLYVMGIAPSIFAGTHTFLSWDQWKIAFNFHPLLFPSPSGLPSVYAQFAAEVGAAFFGILFGGGLLFDKLNSRALHSRETR
jgi:hypothetical protein